MTVQEDGYRVVGRRRGTRSLFWELLAGPEGFDAEGEECGWVNAIWWNGVVLLDERHRLLLVHLADDPPFPRGDLLEVRAWLEAVAARWPRWRVEWAARGLRQVLDYLRLPYDAVPDLEDVSQPVRAGWADSPTEDDDFGRVAPVLVAVGEGDTGDWFAGYWAPGLEQILLAGPDVVVGERHQGQRSAVLEAVPWSGVYVDVPGQRLDWWSLQCGTEAPAVAARWPGWTLTDHGDRFEDVADLIGSELCIDAGTQAEAAERVLAGRPRL
ncbi:hypothetical protein [Actinomadura rupiterrae]|uniref:hypothetical protein n=1 Tax=Actinomadura rupiterrae TaxID=559627 RepID=UPI0020A3D976|nr:hypothetical protein [Actinomadura rupiterrae]MCP2342219.1 hypothetical protein [Actinomadura rupiterrae]